MITLTEAAATIETFARPSLTAQLTLLEGYLQGANRLMTESLSSTYNVEANLLTSALVLKQAAGQINVVIHATGILLALPYLLHEDETVQYVSLGAGNTGRAFDLETSRRVAEFKFTHWRGGAEAIRQNQLFKDFYALAEYDTAKERYLYVVNLEHPLKFLNGRRALSSVLSRNIKLWNAFQHQYGTRFATVRDYYLFRKDRVNLVDVAQIVPQFAQAAPQFQAMEEMPDAMAPE